jgi:deazaflavin-dependent oxidoreductase (nitroreductase family)
MGLRRNVVNRLGRHKVVAVTFAKVVAPLDTRLSALTGGRVTLLGTDNFPQLVITTTGRKSGQPRTVTLLFGRVGDEVCLIGSNFGQEHHPAWALNLEATPQATVEVDGQAFDAVARMLPPGEEQETVWRTMTAIYPGYADYRARVTDREIKVFLLALTPVPAVP